MLVLSPILLSWIMSEQAKPLKIERLLFTVDQVRNYEADAAKASGCDLFTLMERAGQAVYTHWQGFDAKNTLVLVASGNNAGDGYIVARLIKEAGYQVNVCTVEPSKKLIGDAKKARQLWVDAGGEVMAFSAEYTIQADVIVDALLGTGLSSPVRDNYRAIIHVVNHSNKPVLSIDIPSGINANTGKPQGDAIQASKTITFVGMKQGLLTGIGKHYSGQLLLEDLGISKAFMALVSPAAELISIDSFDNLNARGINSHKGTHGKLLCIGGNQGTAGAIRLTSEAALRTGAGMVRVYTHNSSILPVSIGRPELMVSSENLSSALEWASCVVIGPGLGQDKWAEKTFTEVLKYCLSNKKPLVIDADGLNLLAKNASVYRLNNCIITPHSGEAARLMSSDAQAIEANRYYYAHECAKRYTATCVLKGAGTIIDNTQKTWVCENGSPALAVGGSGDVLTGIIGALMAQGLSIDEAACYGVTLHAKAGDIASEQDGERGMLPSDLFAIVRKLINEIRQLK